MRVSYENDSGDVGSSAKIFMQIGSSFSSKKEDKDLKSLGIDSERGKEYLSIMSGIRGVPIWFSVTEEVERGTYRVSIRSKILDISSVASKWRGGGHINASGATLNTLEELPLLIKDLEELIK